MAGTNDIGGLAPPEAQSRYEVMERETRVELATLCLGSIG